MKLIIVGAALALGIAIVSFACGWSMSEKAQEASRLGSRLSNEHGELASKLDHIETKLESMDSKLQLLVNIATRPSPYEADIAR